MVPWTTLSRWALTGQCKMQFEPCKSSGTGRRRTARNMIREALLWPTQCSCSINGIVRLPSSCEVPNKRPIIWCDCFVAESDGENMSIFKCTDEIGSIMSLYLILPSIILRGTLSSPSSTTFFFRFLNWKYRCVFTVWAPIFSTDKGWLPHGTGW